MTYMLHVGDHAYSSWSLRGWMLLRPFGLPVETRLHAFDGKGLDAFRAGHPPAATVPALEWEEGGRRILVWDSLAIAEMLAERHPEAGLWPADAAARAAARSMAAEMHSAFAALRREVPMNVRRDGRGVALSAAAQADLDRLSALWGVARAMRAEGPFLFGSRPTAADAFFAPIVWRVLSYGLAMPSADIAYLETLRALPAMAEWEETARAEPRRLAHYEDV